MPRQYAIVLTTVRNKQEAETLGHSIVDAGLAACVQIQSIRSIYRWKGEVCSEPECLLIIKTTEARYAELEQYIQANHSYDTPEVVKLEITGGSQKYLSWIDESVA